MILRPAAPTGRAKNICFFWRAL